MESKLKALKVVELKDILTKAGVAIPAKANKPELIAKIIATPAATSKFESLHGNGGETPRVAHTPAGGSTPKTTSGAPAKVPNVGSGQTINTDLLAPPEEFDWNTGLSSTVTARPASISTANPESKLNTSLSSDKSKSVPTQEANESTSEIYEQKPADATPTTVTSDDIEAEKRRKRAERFGIPLVEPKPAPTPRAKQQVKRETSTATAAVSEGEKRTPTVVTDNAEKLKARAERFGIKVNGNTTTAKSPSTGSHKRSAPPTDEVDAEELERRRKRAERFKMPIKA